MVFSTQIEQRFGWILTDVQQIRPNQTIILSIQRVWQVRRDALCVMDAVLSLSAFNGGPSKMFFFLFRTSWKSLVGKNYFNLIFSYLIKYGFPQNSAFPHKSPKSTDNPLVTSQRIVVVHFSTKRNMFWNPHHENRNHGNLGKRNAFSTLSNIQHNQPPCMNSVSIIFSVIARSRFPASHACVCVLVLNFQLTEKQTADLFISSSRTW